MNSAVLSPPCAEFSWTEKRRGEGLCQEEATVCGATRNGQRWERTEAVHGRTVQERSQVGGRSDAPERGQKREREGSWDTESQEAAPGGTHRAEEDAYLVAAGVTSERRDAPNSGGQLRQALAAAVHLRLSAERRTGPQCRVRTASLSDPKPWLTELCVAPAAQLLLLRSSVPRPGSAYRVVFKVLTFL